MSYLCFAVVLVVCFSAGVQAKDTRTLNCDGVPFKSIKELRKDGLFDAMKDTKQTIIIDKIGLIDSINLYLCNTVAKPAIWVTLVNSKVHMIFMAVQEALIKDSVFGYEPPKKNIDWSYFEELLTNTQLTELILTGFANIYSRVSLNRNTYLKNRSEIVGYTCAQLKNNFGYFYDDFRAIERLSKNDQLTNNLADYDDNLERLIIVHRTCSMMKF